MTRATLTIHTEPDPVTVEFDVQTEDQVATITIEPGDVKIHTTHPPKVVTT